MLSPTFPFFHSATILAQHPISLSVGQVAPWRTILAVEPNIAVLNAGSLLLTKANYCVTPIASDRELFSLRHIKAAALAILSDRLGHRLLRVIAEMIRGQWPRTRILILGQVPTAFEDYLYDEHIYRSPDPRQVLADLEKLYSGMWNQRFNTLDWNGSAALTRHTRPQ